MAEHPEAVEVLRPGLDQVLESYLKIMGEINNEHVVESLKEFVLTFGDQATKYSN